MATTTAVSSTGGDMAASLSTVNPEWTIMLTLIVVLSALSLLGMWKIGVFKTVAPCCYSKTAAATNDSAGQPLAHTPPVTSSSEHVVSVGELPSIE
jgi:hypothetical protein